MVKSHIPYKCIWQDFNRKRFEGYDVMPYFIREWDEIKKSKKTYTEDEYRGRPQTKEELKNWFLRKSQYMFWSRCEYEVIVSGWPNTDTKAKLDIHAQIEMNIDVVLDVFIKNINFTCPQEDTPKTTR